MTQPNAADRRGWRIANPLQHPVVICGTANNALPTELHLSDDEIARAERLSQSEARARFLLQHHLLRGYLSHWLQIRPDELRLIRNAYGKPSIENCPLQFSISRSGNHLAFYFGSGPGGIDVEEQRSSLPFKSIVNEHFHLNERVVAQDDEGFFVIWTRKEALLKAVGTGLGDGLASLDCSLDLIEFHEQSYTMATYATATRVVSLALAGTDTKEPLCFDL